MVCQCSFGRCSPPRQLGAVPPLRRPAEEYAGDDLVHGLDHVDVVPVGVAGELDAGGVVLRGAVGGEDLKVVGAAAGAATGLVGLHEVIPFGVAHGGEVRGVVLVDLGDGDARMRPPESIGHRLQVVLVMQALLVDGHHAVEVVHVLWPCQSHGQR